MKLSTYIAQLNKIFIESGDIDVFNQSPDGGLKTGCTNYNKIYTINGVMYNESDILFLKNKIDKFVLTGWHNIKKYQRELYETEENYIRLTNQAHQSDIELYEKLVNCPLSAIIV